MPDVSTQIQLSSQPVPMLIKRNAEPYDVDASFGNKHVRSWINQHAFIAMLASFGRVELCVFGLWVMRDAFEESSTPESLDADASAAAQWILHAGQALFRFVQVPRLISPDGFFEVADHGLLYEGEKGNSLQRWQFWRAGFETLAESPASNDEARSLARRAARLMGALEETAPILA